MPLQLCGDFACGVDDLPSQYPILRELHYFERDESKNKDLDDFLHGTSFVLLAFPIHVALSFASFSFPQSWCLSS
jgi:hypothetical protein